MKSIFDDGVHEQVKTRIEKLEPHTNAQWGKMDVAQMLHHCQMPLNIVLQKNTYGLKPNWFAKTFFKKSMYSDTLWKKNMPTLKLFRITDEREFSKEKEALLSLTEELNAERNKSEWQAHPTFGKLTKDQWGKMQYKHLDHHLRQFGV
ncbi:DUF1569 domain-containing protein [Winogradskyella sp. A3E31]|uniref:DUF1569 domain-containing protein n=1 Tax=Winogradskyella sp. A3E31 TaxID=3349637 RepID=UPI00398AAB9E